MNKHLRNLLASFGLVESQSDIEFRKWYDEQARKILAGEEIEPPWVFSPSAEPWSSNWRQGGGEFWIHEIWRPFWERLNPTQKLEYVEKWKAPEEWRESLLGTPLPLRGGKIGPAEFVMNLHLFNGREADESAFDSVTRAEKPETS